MNIQQTLATMGFVKEHNGGGTHVMVWRGKDYTWVASANDGDMPSDDDWLISEYRAGDWESLNDDVRTFSSEYHSLATVIAWHLAAVEA